MQSFILNCVNISIQIISQTLPFVPLCREFLHENISCNKIQYILSVYVSLLNILPNLGAGENENTCKVVFFFFSSQVILNHNICLSLSGLIPTQAICDNTPYFRYFRIAHTCLHRS